MEDAQDPASGGPPESRDTVPNRPRARLAAPLRLKIRADFLRAARGRRAHSRSLTLQAFRRPPDGDSAKGEAATGAGEDRPRFGLTVTKKTGGAVERNRIRRRLREALRDPALAPEQGHDYVIVARRDALSVGFTDLVSELVKTLNEARGGRSRNRGGRSKPAATS